MSVRKWKGKAEGFNTVGPSLRCLPLLIEAEHHAVYEPLSGTLQQAFEKVRPWMPDFVDLPDRHWVINERVSFEFRGKRASGQMNLVQEEIPWQIALFTPSSSLCVSTSNGLIWDCCALAEPGSLCHEVIPFRDTRSPASGNPVMRDGGLMVASHFQQMGANGGKTIVTGKPVVRVLAG